MTPDEAQMRRVARYEFVKRALIIFTAAVVTIILGVLVALAAQSASTTHAIRETQVDNHTLLDTINDCTQPSGDCYMRGQKRTGDAVASINRVVILASACAVGKTGTVAKIQSDIQQCVIDRLARQHATR